VDGAPVGGAGDSGARIGFIDIGRSIAALLVFYTHVDVLYLREHHETTRVTGAVESLLVQPLGMSELGLGQVAVCLFFVISGFVITPIALRMGAGRFAVNRFFRIYPLLAVVVLCSALALWLGLRPLSSPEPPDVSGGSLLANVTLLNFSVPPFGAFVGVAWTLAIEVIFYALLIAVLPLLRRWAWLAIAIELELVLLAILLRSQFADGYDGIAAQAAYLTIPIMGQIIWAGWHRVIQGWLTCGFSVTRTVRLPWAIATRLIRTSEPRMMVPDRWSTTTRAFVEVATSMFSIAATSAAGEAFTWRMSIRTVPESSIRAI
jgi:peptidoglycan/LPS O-acetylase OafA/YrhL